MPAVIERVSKAESDKLDGILRPFEAGGRYVARNSALLLKEHGEGWIAVRESRVIAHSKTRLGLRQRLARKGYNTRQVYTTYLTEKKRTLIL